MSKLNFSFKMAVIMLLWMYGVKSHAQQKNETTMPSRLKIAKVHPKDRIDNIDLFLQYTIERTDNDYVTYKDIISPRSKTPKNNIAQKNLDVYASLQFKKSFVYNGILENTNNNILKELELLKYNH